MPDKCAGNTISLLKHNHINDLDRGGSWKVNEGVIVNFGVAENSREISCLQPRNQVQNKIMGKHNVNALVTSCMAQENFTKLK